MLDAWKAAQNGRDLAAYTRLYAARFEGVRRAGPRERRFDRASWLADRRNMFSLPVSVETADVRVSTADDVSREHAKIRRDPATGAFFLVDLSVHGTTIDGRPVPRGCDDRDGARRANGAESPLGSRARIGLAGRLFLDFEQVT